MARTRIKICGITRIEDALAAEAAGCDAVGLVCWPGSPRFVTPETGAQITAALSALVLKVGVFVRPAMAYVCQVADAMGLDAVQLCGELPGDDWAGLSGQVRIVRALGVRNELPLPREAMAGVCDYVLDTHDEQSPGGTGRTFDWTLLSNPSTGYRVWLAGGLNPANVTRAIATAHPFAVDVSSGIEDRPGVKSHDLMRAFVDAVRTADENTAQM